MLAIALAARFRAAVLKMPVTAIATLCGTSGERQARRVGGEPPNAPGVARRAAGRRPADDSDRPKRGNGTRDGRDAARASNRSRTVQLVPFESLEQCRNESHDSPSRSRPSWSDATRESRLVSTKASNVAALCHPDPVRVSQSVFRQPRLRSQYIPRRLRCFASIGAQYTSRWYTRDGEPGNTPKVAVPTGFAMLPEPVFQRYWSQVGAVGVTFTAPL